MINYQSYTLYNGLRVIVHKAPECAMAALNVMYNVGSRNESPEKTGFAHLFEHLMFGGSVNIKSYDNQLQNVGGTNNAYTTSDITNYYCIMPAYNIETAFWLESDRMLNLAFSQEVLDVQKKVVVEEFKERYLNKPYGDAWLKIRELAYKTHPYKWPTIGKDISHIEDATLNDVKDFFYKYYIPNNAVLVISGGIEDEEALMMCEKWFGPIFAGKQLEVDFSQEPQQTEARRLDITADVPFDAIYKAYHIPGRLSPEYYTVEVMASILGEGYSSRLYSKLVDEMQIFNSISAYTTQSIDPGLLVISGTVSPDFTIEQADLELNAVIEELMGKGISEIELQKAKNNYISSFAFSSLDLLTRSEELAMATLLGNTNMVNDDIAKMDSVSSAGVHRIAAGILNMHNCSTIYYRKKG
jgi:zinc protease